MTAGLDPVLIAVGALAGLGICCAFLGLLGRSGTDTPSPAVVPGRATRPSAGADRHRRLVWLAAGLTGLAALIVTRWPMALPLGALAVLGSRGLAPNDAKGTIARLEAIAAWTEMLRDTLSGAAGLTQALVASAPISPRPLRPQMTLLAARLQSGVAMVPALLDLADDLADPAADSVVACLLLASTERAQRLADLLGALSETTREEVAMRLQIEASRSSARSAVKMITGFSFGLLGLLAVVSRSYLSPYSTPGGQLVLGVVGCVYGVGLWLMSVMARPRVFPRLSLRGEVHHDN
jgi:tight adherence protein B